MWQPWAMHIDVTQDIAAPADRVWAIITDLENSPTVISGIDSVDILGGPDGFGIGTRWRETRTMFGRQATEEMEISELVPGRSYRTEAASHGMNYESMMEVVPVGDSACTLTMRFAGEATSTTSKVMGATIGRLFVGSTRKALAKDLADIAAAAEAQAG